MPNKLKVLSLFDGMSCGQIALNKLNIECEYYASEIDKYAIKVTQHNYPNTIQLGDITHWRNWDIDFNQVDLVLAGSPCQDLSCAGKMKGLSGSRSGLFFTALDILNHIKQLNPNVRFLFENVKMKKESENVFTESLGVPPIEINSSLVSAQIRSRLYWTNIPMSSYPLDKNINLSAILESGMTDRVKSYCIDANYYKGGNLKSYFSKSRRQLVFLYDTKEDMLCGLARGNPDYRKLSPVECERLQTIPEGYSSVVSNTQRYKMIGNGWTVDVIMHLLRGGEHQYHFVPMCARVRINKLLAGCGQFRQEDLLRQQKEDAVKFIAEKKHDENV
jgi:DNA (cytosine-5)-methyltransferase 1